MLLESVLLMVVLLGGFMLLTKLIRERQLVSKLVAQPIQNVATMTAYGTWRSDGCTAPGKSKQTIGKCHPNSNARITSSDPEP
jgi:hypothetical protein